MKSWSKWLTVLSFVTVLDLGYLSWRYLALKAGLVTPGTGLCSWSEGIDCDVVLRTPQARAFFVPNALLGLGFYAGCFIVWVRGSRLGPEHQRRVMGLMVIALTSAALLTFRLFWLLFHLPALCPFCPWNHVLSYGMLGCTFVLWRRSAPTPVGLSWAPVLRVVGLAVAQFWAWLLAWGVALNAGLLAP